MRPVRSTRSKPGPSGGLNVTDQDMAQDSGDDYPDKEPNEPKKRRRKTAATASSNKSIRGRRGKLRQLPEMPLDILFDIFGHLNPLDVLHLSRTTKSLRDILMRRSAISVWKEARSNVEGLPPCPADLTEAHYANLAFSPHCHFCGAPNAQAIFWVDRVRCCQKCIPVNFMEMQSLLYACDLPTFSDAISILPGTVQTNGKWRGARVLYGIAYARAVSAEYVNVRQDPEKRHRFIEENRIIKRGRQEHSALAESWRQSRISNRSNELSEARSRRKEAITAKLTELGWGQELGNMDQMLFQNHALVKQPKDLTERIWSNIKDTMVGFMQEIKAKRMHKERCILIKDRLRVLTQVLKDYALTQPVDEPIPPAADIYDMDVFKAVWEDTPEDVNVTTESFRAAMEGFPALCEQWRESKGQELVELMQKHPEGKQSSLTLATTTFGCFLCSEAISYPRILLHRCTRRLHFCWRNNDDERSRCFEILGCEPWNFGGKRITFNTFISKSANVVKACGMDPAVATTQEMDDADHWVECLRCTGTGRFLMSWKTAVGHARHHPEPSLPSHWRLISDEDREVARAKQTSQLLSAKYGASDWMCLHCRKQNFLHLLIEHIKNEHGIEGKRNIDYRAHPDAPGLGGSPIVQINVPLPDSTTGEVSTAVLPEALKLDSTT